MYSLVRQYKYTAHRSRVSTGSQIMLRCPIGARAPSTQACSCCFEARYIPQALRLILSPRGSASALVRHTASRFNNVSRHVGTCCKPFAQRGDSRSPCSAKRLAARAHAAASAARRRTVKERRQKLHTTEHAMDARSRECASAMERPASRGYRPWRGFPCDKVGVRGISEVSDAAAPAPA